MSFQIRNDGLELLIPVEEVIQRYRLILNDVDVVYSKDRVGIRSMLRKFGSAGMEIGIGYKKAYGSVLSGDSFQLFVLPDDTFLFVFSDVSGHGIEAYTTYVKLRSAAILAVRKVNDSQTREGLFFNEIVKDIVETFTNIMEDSVSRDFACVIFAFVRKDKEGRVQFHFFNRGMYYPYLLIQDGDKIVSKNLNNPCPDWTPSKNSPLGSDFRKLIGLKYNNDSPAILTIENGARLCFFTDGIIEATNLDTTTEEFGFGRLEKSLVTTFHHFPQSAINTLYDEVYDYIENPVRQSDDMTAIVIDIPKNVR